jgi:RNA polymerase sigma factor (sigma-70 family)
MWNMRLSFWKSPSMPPPRASSPTFDDVYEQAFSIAYHTLRSNGVRLPWDLDDACQEVFAIVDQELKRGALPRNVKAWVAGISFKVARRKGRQYARDAARLDYGVDPTLIAAPDEDAGTRERVQEDLVLSLIEEIDNDQQREVIILHYLAEQTIPEIVADLKRPEGTVKWQIQAGLRAMEAALRRRKALGAAVLPLFGVVGLLESLRYIKAPDGVRARVRERLRDLGCGGGGGPIAPGMPPAPSPGTLARAATRTWGGTAVTILGMVALVEAGLIAGLLVERRRASVEARPDTVAAAVTGTPNAPPAPSAAPSAGPTPASTATAPAPMRDPSAADFDAETFILAQAEGALAEGRVKEALKGIEDHARRWHGGGALAQTRETLRADVERYMAAHPNEPQVVELRAHPKGTP